MLDHVPSATLSQSSRLLTGSQPPGPGFLISPALLLCHTHSTGTEPRDHLSAAAWSLPAGFSSLLCCAPFLIPHSPLILIPSSLPQTRHTGSHTPPTSPCSHPVVFCGTCKYQSLYLPCFHSENTLFLSPQEICIEHSHLPYTPHHGTTLDRLRALGASSDLASSLQAVVSLPGDVPR